MEPNIRQVARRLSYRRRGEEAITSNEKVEIKRIENVFGMIFLKWMKLKKKGVLTSKEDLDARKFITMAKVCYSLHADIVNREYDSYGVSKRLHRKITSFQLDDCKPFFRFKRVQLTRVAKLLGFSQPMVLDNGAVMDGEEVFLRGMYELSSGENQFKICKNCFGGDQPLQSRAWTAFLNLVYDNHRHLVNDNLQWFYDNGLMEASAVAIDAKMTTTYGFEPPPDFRNTVCCFIDCNCLSTSVVGGGRGPTR
jgi:hypothetical protein